MRFKIIIIFYIQAIQGSYQYVSPDGTPVQFSYVADENGYQPKVCLSKNLYIKAKT